MKKLGFGLVATAIVLLNSCVIEQEIHFNKDMSGSYALHFDMSALKDLGGDSTSSEDMNLKQEDFDEVVNGLKAASGISNVSGKVEDDIFKLNYDFADVNSLEEANKGDNELGGMLKFEQKGKKLLIDMTPPKEMSEENSEMESVGDMITFKLTINFDRPVKKVKSKLGSFDKASNTLTFNFGMKEMMDEKTNWKSQVAFK